MNVKYFSIAFALAFPWNALYAKTVHYELKVERKEVNLSGKQTVDWALTVNGGIPAPVLEFTEGDDAEIVVVNSLKDEEVSMHWHGILLPPEEDGVAYVNTPPILPGKSRTFRFKIRQHGTYWYHSHTMVQEQKGVYGAFIIHPKEKKIKYDKDVVVVLSDWSDENADQIIKNLRKDGDYYIYKKDTIRSWYGAVRAGALETFLGNEWTRMGGMDLSDVGYDAFLINGKRDSQLIEAHPGERVRIRIINAGASSYFYVSLGQTPMKVISADGVDIEPIMAKELLMGMAETYDVLFEVPEHKNYELRATVQDVTGFASGWIGMGEKVAAPDKIVPDLYASMDHSSHGGDHAKHQGHESTENDKVDHSTMDHSKMDHSKMGHGMETPTIDSNSVATLMVDDLKAKEKIEYPKNSKIHDVKFVLGGDMERYVWHLNGKAIHEDRTVVINENDVVRFTFVNETMMHHPMHLHGHFFRVLTKNNEFSPLKHTVDVPPHGTRTIEFLANEPGEWMLHCHNLYHMKTGMARVIKYSSFTPKPEIALHQKHDPHLHDHIYFNGHIAVATNGAEIGLRLSKTWDTLEADFEVNEYDNLNHAEGALLYRRWLGQFHNLIAGGIYKGEFVDDKTRAVIGFGYTLPLLIEVDFMLDHKAKVSVGVEKKFQWTKFIFTEAEATFYQGLKSEFNINLMYAPSWAWAAGAVFTEENIGVGGRYKF